MAAVQTLVGIQSSRLTERQIETTRQANLSRGQLINSAGLDKVWEIPHKNVQACLFASKTTAFVVFFLSLEFTHSQNGEKSIIRLSCINCTGSVLFCDSIHDKNFLKHCAASLVDTSFWSIPSSSSSLHTLSLSVESPTMVAKIFSSDICGEVGCSFSRLSQSSSFQILELNFVPSLLYPNVK